jgi:transcriptional regulator with XRE-family HTH domain
MATESSLADRVWLAWYSLARDAKGNPPPLKPLELAHRISNGTIKRVLEGERDPQRETMSKIAEALRVDAGWLVSGTGRAPVPTGPVPDRRKALDLGEDAPKQKTARPRPASVTLQHEALERVIAYWQEMEPGRYSAETVGAARATAVDPNESPTGKDWQAYLDSLQAALSGVRMRALVAGSEPVPPVGKRPKGNKKSGNG